MSTTGSGRFLVWSSDPSADTRGSLAHDFKQYNATHGVTAVAGGTAEDGFLYTIAPMLSPSLAGTVSKTYDATTTATLASGNYSVRGVLDGDSVTLNNPASGSYDTKNVGTGKTVTATGISIAGASNGAVTVFGYQLASNSAAAAIGTINAATLTVTADDATRRQTDPNPAFTSTITGFVGGETDSLVSGLTIGSSAPVPALAGQYAIVASGASAPNYVFAYVDGILTVTAGLTPTSPANNPLLLLPPQRRNGFLANGNGDVAMPGGGGVLHWTTQPGADGTQIYGTVEASVNTDDDVFYAGLSSYLCGGDASAVNGVLGYLSSAAAAVAGCE